MLYYLFEWLDKFDIAGAGLLKYTSVRAALAAMLAIIVALAIGNRFMDLLKRKRVAETARDESIDKFGVEKKGVPTMGGLIIIIAILVPILLLCKLDNVYVVLMLITTVMLGALGFADDYIKTFRKNKDGVKPYYKLLVQLGVGLIVGLTLYYAPSAVIRENVEVNIGNHRTVVVSPHEIKSPQTTTPFLKANNLNYVDAFNFIKDNDSRRHAGWILFVVITVIALGGTSNGANLNDGMDGMTAGIAAIIGIALGIFAYVSSHIEFAGYFNIMYIPGSEELVIFICAFVGALLGFLWYNSFPAQVFMGDTGSLTIGGIIAVFAILIHKEILLIPLCGVWLLEVVSSYSQTLYAKMGTRKGVVQRIFKRAPIHDHFRYDPVAGTHYIITKPCKLYHENKITMRFWLVTLLLAVLTILTLKIR